MKMCFRISVQNMKKMWRRILHKNMRSKICVRGKQAFTLLFLFPPVFFSSWKTMPRETWFSAIHTSLNIPRFIVFANICHGHHNNGHYQNINIIYMSCTFLSLCLKGWLSTPYQFVVFAFLLSQLFLLSLSLLLFEPSAFNFSLLLLFCLSLSHRWQ